jgi:flagellar protein FliO/FliZ
MTTWIWIVILFVVLGIGIVLGMPYERIEEEGLAAMPALGSTGQLISVFLKWISVIGLMYVAFIFLKRWQSGGSNSQIRQLSVVERLSISQRQAVLIVRVGSRKLVLGVTDQNISFITELDDEDEIRSETKPGEANTLDGGNGFSSGLENKMTGSVSDLFVEMGKKRKNS